MGLLADDYKLMAVPLQSRFWLSMVATQKTIIPARPLAIEVGLKAALSARVRMQLSGDIAVGTADIKLLSNVRYGASGTVTAGVHGDFSEKKRVRPEAAVVSVGASEAYLAYKKSVKGVSEAVTIGSSARTVSKPRFGGTGAVTVGAEEGAVHAKMRTGDTRPYVTVGARAGVSASKGFGISTAAVAVGLSSVGLSGRRKRKISEADSFTTADERGLQELFFVTLE